VGQGMNLSWSGGAAGKNRPGASQRASEKTRKIPTPVMHVMALRELQACIKCTLEKTSSGNKRAIRRRYIIFLSCKLLIGINCISITSTAIGFPISTAPTECILPHNGSEYICKPISTFLTAETSDRLTSLSHSYILGFRKLYVQSHNVSGERQEKGGEAPQPFWDCH
jgi:hypothetical protein